MKIFIQFINIVINKELENFSKKLIDKPSIIIANKMDMESSNENLKEKYLE
jgi:GTPase involved in cell partitioning and DNA repair